MSVDEMWVRRMLELQRSILVEIFPKYQHCLADVSLHPLHISTAENGQGTYLSIRTGNRGGAPGHGETTENWSGNSHRDQNSSPSCSVKSSIAGDIPFWIEFR
ncbi:hypothetical protein CDAR_440911 [Caerostris darwini]|uniref:Uncharacterized protein n=1 Tax=Caerostris darwini TaxID=1538125 RepID=A0AAV4TMG7_9ARAC|nr:hypothetical protein CDAR_440911 [Caerostris darwini]